ncbi:hypothetical protein DOY81_005804 [Sarcophaga bullata]|nr:hypothetical protein DOY81_005804 [Sarcophaga bullata]
MLSSYVDLESKNLSNKYNALLSAYGVTGIMVLQQNNNTQVVCPFKLTYNQRASNGKILVQSIKATLIVCPSVAMGVVLFLITINKLIDNNNIEYNYNL